MKLKILILLLILIQTCAYAYEVPVCISVNGENIKTENSFLENGVTYVPLRFVSNALGAESVDWKPAENTATVALDGKNMEFTIGKDYAVVDGKRKKLNGPVRLKNSRTYLPVRFIAEESGSEVMWNQPCYRVEITKENYSVPQDVIEEKSYDDEHIYWLAKIISSESGGESLDGKIAVGNVVLNRVENAAFPNTIYGVIFDRNYGVQFQPVLNGTIHNPPTGESYLAAKLSLEGENTAGESLYFLNPRKADNFWIPNNRVFYKSIGNHDFYL